MAFSLPGVSIPHRKSTSDMPPVKMTAVQSVTIPTVMHIGAPAVICVKNGDTVKIGDLIAEQGGFVSAPIHASISGTVKLTESLLSNGTLSPAVTIESDGEMALSESIAPPTVTSKEEFIEAVKKSGMVGLGGAGFPTYVKFATDKKIEHIVINGAECEPYITSDNRTMIDRVDDMKVALEALFKYIAPEKVIFGVERNKPKAISSVKTLVSQFENASVKVLSNMYPQGGEKVLIYHTTGKVVPMGKLPIDVGCVVLNCTTLASIGAYLKTGIPLVEKCITVDGGSVREPKNVIVPIGTSMKEVFDFCGGFKEPPKKVLYGGPMMGIAVPSTDVPVLKNTNAILAFNEKEATLPKTTTCISCGNCVLHCPLGINPVGIANSYRLGNLKECENLGVMLCMECGCCSYICPAARPLVQTNRIVKIAVKKAAAEKKAKEEKKNG